ncbi:MAG: hypothetical protein F6K55_35155 [Moorea sp. SIO4A3]|nr:hypothetical protein [Moorena sp. SIO4A3]
MANTNFISRYPDIPISPHSLLPIPYSLKPLITTMNKIGITSYQLVWFLE